MQQHFAVGSKASVCCLHYFYAEFDIEHCWEMVDAKKKLEPDLYHLFLTGYFFFVKHHCNFSGNILLY